MELRQQNQRAAALAQERGYLDAGRAEALLRLGERWGVPVPQAGFQAEWLSWTQAQELASACGVTLGGTVTATPSSAARAVPREGSRVGDYVLEKHLASGAMGSVFVARLLGVEVRHALKLMALGAGGEPAAARWGRFEREARSLSRLDHPGVVRVHAFGVVESGDFGYMSMDLVEGTTLEELLKTGLLTVEQQLEIAAGLARALAHVHAAGIMHRDVKPANVMIRRDTGLPVLCDFGLVRHEGDLTLTKSQALLGTPRYMAPELVTGDRQRQGPPTDVFALGVIVYHMLCGSYPFEAGDLPGLAGQILEKTPDPPSKLAGEDRGLDRAVLQALAKAPEDRLAAGEVADAIQRSLSGEGHGQSRSVTAGVLGVCLILIVGGVAWLRATSPGTASPAPESPETGADPAPERAKQDALAAIAGGRGDDALAAVTSALAGTSASERREIEVLQAQALLLVGRFGEAEEHLPAEDYGLLRIERKRRALHEWLQSLGQDYWTWEEGAKERAELARLASRVTTDTPLGRVVRARLRDLMIAVTLEAPVKEGRPTQSVYDCLELLADVLGDDVRAPIVRKLVVGVLGAEKHPVSEADLALALPDPDGLADRWRANVLALRGVEHVIESNAPAARVLASQDPGPELLAGGIHTRIEQHYHYHARTAAAQWTRQILYSEIVAGAPSRESLARAIESARRALRVARSFHAPGRRNAQAVRLAEIYACAGRYDEALASLAEVVPPDREFELRADLTRIEIVLERGDPRTADTMLHALDSHHSSALTLSARVAHARDRPGDADLLLAEAEIRDEAVVPWRRVNVTRRILAGDDPRIFLRQR